MSRVDQARRGGYKCLPNHEEVKMGISTCGCLLEATKQLKDPRNPCRLQFLKTHKVTIVMHM